MKNKKDSLVNQIHTELNCKEEQTKDIIELLLSDIQLFDKKQGDYGPSNICKFGVMGVLVRSSDKIERLINLYKKNTLEEGENPATRNTDESVIDSWSDLSVYGAIARVVAQGKWNK